MLIFEENQVVSNLNKYEFLYLDLYRKRLTLIFRSNVLITDFSDQYTLLVIVTFDHVIIQEDCRFSVEIEAHK